MKRWRMNRMGILNFWLYDEEVFELEQGRLLFRGANAVSYTHLTLPTT